MNPFELIGKMVELWNAGDMQGFWFAWESFSKVLGVILLITLLAVCIIAILVCTIIEKIPVKYKSKFRKRK